MMYDPAKDNLEAQLRYNVAVNVALVGHPKMTHEELVAMNWAYRMDGNNILDTPCGRREC